MLAKPKAEPTRTSLVTLAFLVVLVGGASGACGATSTPAPTTPSPTPSPTPEEPAPTPSEPLPTEPGARTLSADRLEYAHSIPDDATFLRLAARPESSTYARTEVVKFLVDVTNQRTVWFIDTQRWDIHYTFARDRLAFPGQPIEDHAAFNVREYRRPERRFEMGSLVHFLDSDEWTFELISGDTLSGERIATLHRQLASVIFAGSRLRFHPISPTHEQSIASVDATRLPRASTDELFGGMRYQPLTEGLAFGTLRLVRGAFDQASARPDEILVFEHLPDEIPVVGGVVSSELQAPLGHIAILCATRNTPNMALRGAIDDPRLVALDGHLVALNVQPQDFGVREASRTEAEAAWARLRPTQSMAPRRNTRERRLRQVCDLHLEDAITVGAKAAQLGEACRLGGAIRTPGGFTIPFAHYVEHIERHGIQAEIDALLHDLPTLDAATRATRLAAIREHISTAEVAPALVNDVRRRMLELARDRRFIFRSSTNAEDLPGFTGAGLYRSIVVAQAPEAAVIAQTIADVWASVWLLGAFRERDWYRVEQREVAMAILVQPFVDGARANGVAITANPFFQGRPGYFVNAQALGGSVTGATGDEVPEQHIIYTYSEVIESELLSRSTRSPGELLLGDAQTLELAEVLTTLHNHFIPRWGNVGVANAVDVEFLIAGDDRHVVIVQARPYLVRYTADQRWDL